MRPLLTCWIVDRLLTQGVATPWSEGLIELASLSQDGIRIRRRPGRRACGGWQALANNLLAANRLRRAAAA